MSRPLFSCVVPVKGERPYFDAAMASLHAQGLGDDLEIIVQDADIEPDRGQSDAFNKGFAKARGEWFFWLNADDVLLPGALEKVRNVIHSLTSTRDFDSLTWIVGDTLKIGSDGRCVGASVGPGWKDALFRHVVPHVYGPSAFFRRELLETIDGFDVSLQYCMDWDLWIRFMRAGARYIRVGSYLWGLRQWEGSKTQRKKSAEECRIHWAEVDRMLAKNAFRVTRTGIWKQRIWRILNGNYLKEFLGHFVGGRYLPSRAALLLMHPAPYRDPVASQVVKDGGIDVFAIFSKDGRHGWAEFSNGYKVLAGRRLWWRLLLDFVLASKYKTVLWPAYYPWWLTLPIIVSAVIGKRYGMTSDTKEENGGLLSRVIKGFIYRHAAFVFVPGKAARDFLVNQYRVKPERVIQGLFLVSREEVTKDRSRKGGPRRNFLMVANDIPGRRIDVLVDGFRRARQEGDTLTLCGTGCGKYNGAGVVCNEGVVWADLMGLYDAADVYVHNGMEQYSTTVQIAALRGMPIICSGDVGIVSDFEKAEEDMLVVRDWRSADAWERAFEQLRGMGDVELKRMCEKVERDSAALYDVKKVSVALSGALRG